MRSDAVLPILFTAIAALVVIAALLTLDAVRDRAWGDAFLLGVIGASMLYVAAAVQRLL